MRRPSGDEVEASTWWSYACATARSLRAGQRPPAVDIYGPLLNADEDGRLSVTVLYSRLYGGNASYARSNLFAFGSIPFMIGAYGVNELMNQSRKAAAQREAAVQWRETQMASAVVTSQRLLCGTMQGWLSFWFRAATEFFPDLDNWAVTLGFGGQVPPLRLSGPPAPVIALWTAHAVLGPRWLDDPRLDRLR
ncbi:hypothetical protein ACRU13_19055 [Mycobacterium colombiense]